MFGLEKIFNDLKKVSEKEPCTIVSVEKEDLQTLLNVYTNYAYDEYPEEQALIKRMENILADAK